MMVFFNLLGFGFLLIGVAVAIGISELIPGSNEYFYLISGGTVSILDILYRQFVVRPKAAKLRDELPEGGVSLFKSDMNLIVPISNFGGSLMLLPAWLFGFFWMLFLGYILL
jgi:hypothetical protein